MRVWNFVMMTGVFEFLVYLLEEGGHGEDGWMNEIPKKFLLLETSDQTNQPNWNSVVVDGCARWARSEAVSIVYSGWTRTIYIS